MSDLPTISLPSSNGCLDLIHGNEPDSLLPDSQNAPEATVNDEITSNPDDAASKRGDDVPDKTTAKEKDSVISKHSGGRDISDVSPFKLAVKGFVLNKLSKKVGTPHLFSGLTERIVRKLEDGKDHTISSIPDSAGDKSGLDAQNELDDELPFETTSIPCELKSVVANDLNDIAAIEEASECFEEIKSSSSDCGGSRKLYLKPKLISRSLPSSPAHHFTPRVCVDSMDNSKDSSDSEEKSASGSIHSDFCNEIIPNLSFHTSTSKLNKENELVLNNDNDNKKQEFNERVPITDAAYLEKFNEKSVLEKSTNVLSTIRKVIEAFPVPHIILVTTLIIHNFDIFSKYYINFIFDGFVIAYIIYTVVNALVLMTLQATSDPKVAKDSEKTPTIERNEINKTMKGSLKLLKGNYDPEEQSHSTELVEVIIENQCLRISHTRSETEEEPAMPCEVFDLSGSEVCIVPKTLKQKRYFRKRHPICINLPTDSNTPSTPKVIEENADFVPLIAFQDGLLERPRRSTLYLFALTDREKETWYYALAHASKPPELMRERNLSLYAEPPSKLSVQSVSYSPLMDKATNDLLSEDLVGNLPLKFSQHKPKPSLDFDEYMKTLFENYLRNIYASRDHSSSEFMGSAFKNVDVLESKKSFPVAWFNVVLGRLFYDVLTQKYWSDYVMKKIQKKLDKIEMPSFMESLVVTDVLMGSCIPEIHSVSNPVTDKFGLWIDFDLTYNGSFQMTLQTRLKLPKSGGGIPNNETENLEIKQSLENNESSDDDGSAPTTSSAKRSKIINKLEKWISHKHFQTVAQNKFVKKYVGDISNMLLTLTVEVHLVQGILAVNMPPVPSDRIWYSFRTDPEMSITASPKVGTHEINATAVVKMIEQRLIRAFKKAVVLPNMDDLIIPIMYSPLKHR